MIKNLFTILLEMCGILKQRNHCPYHFLQQGGFAIDYQAQTYACTDCGRSGTLVDLIQDANRRELKIVE